MNYWMYRGHRTAKVTRKRLLSLAPELGREMTDEEKEEDRREELIALSELRMNASRYDQGVE